MKSQHGRQYREEIRQEFRLKVERLMELSSFDENCLTEYKLTEDDSEAVSGYKCQVWESGILVRVIGMDSVSKRIKSMENRMSSRHCPREDQGGELIVLNNFETIQLINKLKYQITILS